MGGCSQRQSDVVCQAKYELVHISHYLFVRNGFLIELADDADATADALRVYQAYMYEVVKRAVEPAQSD